MNIPLDMKLETLGYTLMDSAEEMEYSFFGNKHAIDALHYYYDVLEKCRAETLSFPEALNVFTNSYEGRGAMSILGTTDGVNDSIEILLDLEEPLNAPYLEWRARLPTVLNSEIKNYLHYVYQIARDDPHIQTFMSKATNFFFNHMQHYRNKKAETVANFHKIKAGHTFFGKHFTELETDSDKGLANTLYVLFKNEIYSLGDKPPILYDRGNLRILMELDKEGWLSKEQSSIVSKTLEEFPIVHP